MTEKRIKDLERIGRTQNIVSMFCYVFAIVLAITGFITNNDYARAFCVLCWILGFFYSTQSYQCYNDRRVAILNMAVDKLLDVPTAEDKEAQNDVPEEETKETVIVSPEDFERFSRGEMTKEELLGIKKAVDKVTKAKTKAS